ncbi:PREDICTED: ABC transporter G family member 42-like [Tarenaya hassleriana]|uniref:ABC transporter G family member 42-like n=1 Tax=Tarenaya hassleriana TaxID=28532 RepID=UPI00053C6AA5|nr:PREDICTED: ABC transporter G family member 42-like [Tarenaya hassleriana]
MASETEIEETPPVIDSRSYDGDVGNKTVNDNLLLFQRVRKRFDKVGMEFPKVEVRFKNISVEAECEVVRGKPLPTLWNSFISVFMFAKQRTRRSILRDVSGVIRPGRMTLLLGPPGCGKTTLLLALSGRLRNTSLQVEGEINYNEHSFSSFVPEKTASYVSQNDVHIPELSVRETLDFSACCQGSTYSDETIKEINEKEKLKGIEPDPETETYMKAGSVEGMKNNIQTDYILKILGLDTCANTRVGDEVIRGISGGQRKRLTTGEMIVGPIRNLFMDEISNGLDSSTTFQIISCLRHFACMGDATVLISLLQPAPETFELFDDLILMAEGKVVYHGPRTEICSFFEDCGFKCPKRKGVADFIQEVISKKDQEQYWWRTDQPYGYVSTDQFIDRFRKSHLGLELEELLSKPFESSRAHEDSLCFRKYSLSKWDMLKACTRRELLLMKRNSFVYVFKSGLLLIVAAITMTVFLHTGDRTDVLDANYLMGSLFYALFVILVDGYPELTFTLSRLTVFGKQKEIYFYPAWAYAVPSIILKIPLSLMESFVWSSMTYFVIGYSREASRFFKHFLILFSLHLSSISMFRAIAALLRTFVASTTMGAISILVVALFGGFLIPKHSMPSWLEWGFWLSPLSYVEIGITTNEFLAQRWREVIHGNITLGEQVLSARGLNFGSRFYWVAFCIIIGFSVFFNVVFVLALTFLKAPQRSKPIISDRDSKPKPELVPQPKNRKVVSPFEPLSVTFQGVQYYVDATPEMRKKGLQQNKLQLLSDITGAFRPGVLTALMGASGAGKTTLFDVLSGRKTGGTIEGEIRVGGYVKVQDTFARVSGYCEQFDVHSPNLTVEESLMHSAFLRLPGDIDTKTKKEIVNEVLETIELEEIKESMVGIPGKSGLSTEQRKRLTIAVELVANPSIIFLDEPTTGLDARAAAIVMRAVKNIVSTGRTVVCTIHQPSIDIFEAFDELILMKTGGKLIYYGPIGQNSRSVIEYFENISGVPKIQSNYNPATWMLDVTSRSMENVLGIDFAQTYKESALFMENKVAVEQLSSAPRNSKDLHFSSRYPQNGWAQFKACLWKQQLSYWRNPSYNLTRLVFVSLTSVLFGLLYWQKAKKINNEQDVFSVLGSMYISVFFMGMNNCSTVLFVVATERNVFYRERFARMYSSWAYSWAQVVVELPYSLIQSLVFIAIVYPMMGYSMSIAKVLWTFYIIFWSFLIFNYLGMLLVAITPTLHVAFTLRSAFYAMVNLFSGYLMPEPNIPKWWLWMYYLNPTSWVLNGLLTTQYGDMNEEIISVFGQRETTVSSFLEEYYGYRQDMQVVVRTVLVAFSIVLAFMFAFFMGKLNFQKK